MNFQIPTMKDSGWKAIFQLIPYPCLLVNVEPNLEMKVIAANECFQKLWQVSIPQLQEKPQIIRPSGERSSAIWDAALELLLASNEKQSTDPLKYQLEKNAPPLQLSVDLIPLSQEESSHQVLVSFGNKTQERELENRIKVFQQEVAVRKQEYSNFIKKNPDGLYRLDLNGNFIQVNEGLAKMAGTTTEELIGISFLPFCSGTDQSLIVSHFHRACEGKITSFEAEFVSNEAQRYILKILLMPMFLDEKVVEVHGIAKDVTAARQTERIMVEKSRFLEVNAAFISTLVDNDIDEEALREAFGIIGNTVEADRMYYFGADKDPESGEILISQKVEWCSSRAAPQIDNPELQNMPLKMVKEIMSPLIKNLPFSAVYSELQEGELKEIFIDEQIKSMLLLPIFVEEELFGFVGFDDCCQERQWKEEEISFLRSLTQNLTNAFEKKAALDKVRNREAELKRSEQKFRSLVQEGSDLIAILDPDGSFSFVSDNYSTILGLDPNELRGQNAYDFVHPEDAEKVKEQFFQLQHQKQVRISPYRFRNRNSQWKWMQTTATNLFHDSAVQGVVANSRDITTIIEQAREIEHINERYQLAATATQDLIYDWDLVKNSVTRFHKGSRNLFGYTEAEVNKREFWNDRIHPEDVCKETEKLTKALADPAEKYIITEYRFRKADGDYARVVDKGYIIRNFSGKAIRLIGAVSDVSELTLKKEALRVANQRFKMAMKATNEMIWDWEIATDSVTRSKGYKKIFGYDTTEATSVHSFWLKKVLEPDRKRLEESLEKALQDPGRKKWELEYRIRKADGSTAYVTDRGYIIRNEHGTATRVVGAVLDVTNSRRLINKIKHQNSLLKEIAWEQSHVVRAPLARIKGLLHLLMLEDYNEMSRKDILCHMQNSADELDSIIRSIVGKTEKLDAEKE